MTEEELLQLIEKYMNLSIKFEPEDEEKSMAYERFAEFLEGYSSHSGLSDSDTEENLWENFKEAAAEVGNYWGVELPYRNDNGIIDRNYKLRNMIEIERLLSEVRTIGIKYDFLAKITGENYNIFQILGLQTAEVRLHSAFLAELLNVHGSHNQGDKFLLLFISKLELKPEFSTSLSKTYIEYPITKISDDSENGGRIDILIEDTNKNRIIIENKIYADDQPNQLVRYKNFDKNADLIYLSLFGTKPSDESCRGLKINSDYRIFSYEKHIKEWLEECMKESTTLPIIRETIHQYINLIKKLTNQSTFDTMKMEIIKVFCNQPEYFKTVPSIIDAYKNFILEISIQFFKMLEEKLNNQGFEMNIEGTEFKIQLQAAEDNISGFYFAYRIAPIHNLFRCNIQNKPKNVINEAIVLKNDQFELFEKYSKIVTDTIRDSKSTTWSLGWYNSLEFRGNKRLDQIDVYKYVSLYDPKKCKDYIDTILLDELENFNLLESKILISSQ